MSNKFQRAVSKEVLRRVSKELDVEGYGVNKIRSIINLDIGKIQREVRKEIRKGPRL
jgi:hypothetical protein